MLDPAFVARALAFGVLIGFSLGALGAGGSILTVPILVYAMGVPVESATGTSLAVVGINAATGARDRVRRGRSLPRMGLAFGTSGVLGALAGGKVASLLPGRALRTAFAALIASIALYTFGRSIFALVAPTG